MLHAARIYLALIGAALRTEAQYRANLMIMIIGGLAYQGLGLAFVGVVVGHFGAIGGWPLADVAFLYGLRLVAHGLWVLPFGQLTSLDTVINNSSFDIYLVRPANPLLQHITRRINLQSFGDLIGGVALLGFASAKVDVDWSPGSVAFMILAVVGGALVEVSAQLAISSLSFTFVSTRAMRTSMDTVFNTFGNYPLTIFPAATRFAATFCIPMAFVAYFPASVLLRRTSELSVATPVAYLSPVVGVVLFVGAYRLWMRQTAKYSSSGN